MLFSAFVLFFIVTVAVRADESCGAVPMSAWAGQETLRKQPLSTPAPLVVVHHTVYEPCASDEECVSVIKNIRAYHMNKLGFDDIGESFLVGGNGKVYEGAGWKFVGSHTKGYNARSVDISFIGDFRKVLPTPAALQAAGDFLACAVKNGHLAQDYQLVGHQQVTQTESPGATLQQEIQTWPHWTANVD